MHMDSVCRGADDLAAKLAADVTIHRDEWGVPHIEGPTDAGVAFGFAYAQAEDYFWQIEDTYAASLGRYAELYGEQGIDSDLLCRSFEIPRQAAADYPQVEPQLQAIGAAFAAGLNHYLVRHPEVKPRLLTHFEPWHPLAYERFVLLKFLFGKSNCARWPGEKAGRRNGSRHRFERLGDRSQPHQGGHRHAVRQSAPTLVRLWAVL